MSRQSIHKFENAVVNPSSQTHIKTEVLKYVTRLMELEELLNVERAFENPLTGFQVVTERDIEKAARIIRRKWKLT